VPPEEEELKIFVRYTGFNRRLMASTKKRLPRFEAYNFQRANHNPVAEVLLHVFRNNFKA
jgi:hypothetical protein